MNYKSSIYLIPILFICFTFCGCKKSKEKKITGSWEMINVISQTPDFVEYWKFDSDGAVYRYEYYGGDTLIEKDRGTWEIVQKIDKAFVNMLFEGVASEQLDLNKAWRIRKLNKEVMILLFIEDGINTKEFKKTSFL